MPNQDAIYFIMEEYKRLYDEIGRTMVNRLTIIGFGLAAIGVLLGFAVKDLQGDITILGSVILGIMVPATAFMTVFLWSSEVRRGRRASWYIWWLERRINKEMNRRVLRWEEDIRPPEANPLLRLFRGHYYIITIFFTVVGGFSAYFGAMAWKWNIWFSLVWAIVITGSMLAVFVPLICGLSKYDKPDEKFPEPQVLD